jgi:adenylate cyclase
MTMPGNILPPGHIGEIYGRCDGYPDFTYHGKPDKRTEVERGGFITSGDVGYIDEEGYLFICDRKRDMLISGGVNMYPAEIEAVLHTLPGVQDCAVFGIPDQEFGEAVMAVVEPQPGMTLDPTALRKALGHHLANYKVPKHIEVRLDLPREDSGKILSAVSATPIGRKRAGASELWLDARMHALWPYRLMTASVSSRLDSCSSRNVLRSCTVGTEVHRRLWRQMDLETRPDRRLAAVMATDVVGYSSLMQSDEADALAALATIREASQNQIKQHRGRIANTAGDSVLAEFGTAVDAVRCAMALQQELSARAQEKTLEIRIGIHLGDVVDKGGDLFGTAVNVAARLEGIAQPGGIVVSAAVRDAIAGKLAAPFTDLGLQNLKNIGEPLRAYALSSKSGPLSPVVPYPGQSLPLPNKPSIAVLPFDDLSANRDQGYFADGVAEEIITALSRFQRLFVIARNSSFAYRGRAVDVKQIGRELGVRYVLEGSIRKAGNKVRITGQLIDASTGAHLWADRFEGALKDIFGLQDQVTASVVGAIAPKLEQAEIERARRKPTENLDAYDHYLRGLAGLHQWTREGNHDALASFYRAIELDPNFASACGMAARCYSQRRASGWVKDRQWEIIETERLARLATELGKDDAIALCTAGIALDFVVGNADEGEALIQRALGLNPNLAWAWFFGGWIKVGLGEPEVAIERLGRALRLSPNDPHSFGMQSAMAAAHFIAGRYAEALSWAEVAVRQKPNFLLPLYMMASERCTGRTASRRRKGHGAGAYNRSQLPPIDTRRLPPLSTRGTLYKDGRGSSTGRPA